MTDREPIETKNIDGYSFRPSLGAAHAALAWGSVGRDTVFIFGTVRPG